MKLTTQQRACLIACILNDLGDAMANWGLKMNPSLKARADVLAAWLDRHMEDEPESELAMAEILVGVGELVIAEQGEQE